MNFLLELSELYYTGDLEQHRMWIAQALLEPELDKFIDQYKDGWTGVAGNFARVMSRVVQAI